MKRIPLQPWLAAGFAIIGLTTTLGLLAAATWRGSRYIADPCVDWAGPGGLAGCGSIEPFTRAEFVVVLGFHLLAITAGTIAWTWGFLRRQRDLVAVGALGLVVPLASSTILALVATNTMWEILQPYWFTLPLLCLLAARAESGATSVVERAILTGFQVIAAALGMAGVLVGIAIRGILNVYSVGGLVASLVLIAIKIWFERRQELLGVDPSIDSHLPTVPTTSRGGR